MPLVRDPKAKWDHVAITTYGRGNHAIRSEEFRYIRYEDGSEELYDHRVDPNEWRNVAGEGKYAAVKRSWREAAGEECGEIAVFGEPGERVFPRARRHVVEDGGRGDLRGSGVWGRLGGCREAFA